ncbi:GTP 3',8-cyclase MoaA [Acidipropionibacterium virtanenii]|uniref:GTP 3',8-cyclase n=1 Tax=Acidipropionibacterium virtanenii TaxID=2057246 RepID=A0A344UY15_9ACTN|nr:GTP 3',8-cyclase MoaA [Acidipropionibacterium virtanenii]AXE40163.1 GTP 3',8-cyclase 2 [Acidipropionibacterium virtanenii]
MSVSARVESLPDRFGRVATDLRVSVTDKCNLRCTYCMPVEGMVWLPREELLTDDELIRLIGIGVKRLGITKVRFTGGEPLVRPTLESLVAATVAMRTPDGVAPATALTTNGIGLDRRAAGLAAAGLGRVNISLDSIDPGRFAAVARRDRLDDVLAGIDAALDAGLSPVKINAVPQRSYRDDAPELLSFCLDRDLELRFIEYMPIGAPGWSADAVISADDMFDALRSAGYTLAEDPGPRGSAPAQRWTVTAPDGRTGRMGIIASVTRPFCGDCSRTRLTADGQIRNCLFSTRETDLRSAIRSGADDDELIKLWQGEMWRKAAAHGSDGAHGSGGFGESSRRMSAIGG